MAWVQVMRRSGIIGGLGAVVGRSRTLLERSLVQKCPGVAAPTNDHPRTFSHSTATPRNDHSRRWKRTRAKLACATAAGSCLFLGLSIHSTAFCKAKPRPQPHPPNELPQLSLYQYKTCPFCSKTRAYLDYSGVAYDVVEVNPLFKREMKFSKYRNVPFVVTSDGTQINDSNLVISVLQTFTVNAGKEPLSQVQELYPEMSYTDDKGKTRTERGNKYFIMYGETGSTEDLAMRREEREWREWVDQKLVHALSPNIYRTPSEALQAFQYISTVGNFSMLERVAAKYFGAVIMYFISKRLKKRYELKEEVRESLYDFCKEWTDAVGKDRRFMGGEKPNLADLAVYGVLSSIEGLTTFEDMMVNTDIGPWYREVKKLVQAQQGNSSTTTIPVPP